MSENEKYSKLMIGMLGLSLIAAALPVVLDLPRFLDPMPWPQVLSQAAHTAFVGAYCYFWGRSVTATNTPEK